MGVDTCFHSNSVQLDYEDDQEYSQIMAEFKEFMGSDNTWNLEDDTLEANQAAVRDGICAWAISLRRIIDKFLVPRNITCFNSILHYTTSWGNFVDGMLIVVTTEKSIDVKVIQYDNINDKSDTTYYFTEKE